MKYVTFSKVPTVAIKLELPKELLGLEKRISKKLPGVVKKIAIQGKTFWKSVAGQKLKSSRKMYQDAIQFNELSILECELTLTDQAAVQIELGTKKFDMKPKLMQNAKRWGKFKIPRAKAAALASVGKIQMYKIIPLNVNRRVNFKPTVFRTVHDKSPAKSWWYPNRKGYHLAKEVMTHLSKTVIPDEVKKLLRDAK